MFVVDRAKPGVISLDSGRFTISLGSLWLRPTRGSSLLKRVRVSEGPTFLPQRRISQGSTPTLLVRRRRVRKDWDVNDHALKDVKPQDEGGP